MYPYEGLPLRVMTAPRAYADYVFRGASKVAKLPDSPDPPPEDD